MLNPSPRSQSGTNYSSDLKLYIIGPTNRTQQAAVPYGVPATLLAVSPKGGYGYLTDINTPDCLRYSQYYNFTPSSQIYLTPSNGGRHLVTFSIGDLVSNPVTIDITSNYLSNYYGGNRFYGQYFDFFNYGYHGYNNDYYNGTYRRYSSYNGYDDDNLNRGYENFSSDQGDYANQEI